jgi:carboxyl-terminal processing protease
MKTATRARILGAALGLLLVAILSSLLGAEEAASPGLTKSNAAKPAPEKSQAQQNEEYELLRLFADTLDQVERNYVEDIDRRELMEAAIRGMLSKLDPYSNFIPPKELDRFRSNVENEFGGIGITVSSEGGPLTIVSPLYGTPAYRAGLRGGDKITHIEGLSTQDISIGEAIRRMKGKIGTSLKITVAHAGSDKEEPVELKRELIRVDTILGERRKADDRWDFFLDDDEKLGYIRISSFSRHTADDLRQALGDLVRAGMRGLVLDLRFNPGGLLTAAIEVSDLFVAEGRIVSTAGRNIKERIWNAKQEGSFEGFPMVVLVNHYSASASEIVAACLQDHQRAVIVGQRTWGKGSVQNIIELEDGKSALKLTTAGYVRPSGKNIHRQQGAQESDEWGVMPSPGMEVVLTEDESTTYLRQRRLRDAIVARPADGKADTAEQTIDRQLQKGLDYLREQLAKNQPVADATPAK